MNQKEMLKNILTWYSSSFQNTTNVINLYQEQAENLTKNFIANSNLPEDSKKVIEEWFEFMRQSQSDFKESMETGLKQLETYLVSLVPED
jgi:polyhydroxyalkanoate synthesis regulator phasin